MQLKHVMAALVAASAGGAWAQSSVTVGGIVDTALRSVKNEGSASVKSLVSGSNATSRMYFRGEEDLGGGLSAGFWLETGIAIDTGSSTGGSTQFFDRRATLSLASRQAGEVRLGRDYVPTYTIWSRHDPFTHVGVAGSNNFSSATPLGPIRNAFGTSPNTTVRSSNAVQYLLPGNLMGIEGGLMIAVGEGGTAANGQDKLVGGRIGWQGAAFGVHASRVTTQNDLTTTGKFMDSLVAVNGTVGPVRLNAALRRYQQAQAKQNNLMLSAIAILGAFEVKASYLKANMQGRVGTTAIDANDANQIGIGGVYNLSKRTAVYAQAARIDNDGRGNFVLPGGAALTAGGQSRAWEAGVRHAF